MDNPIVSQSVPDEIVTPTHYTPTPAAPVASPTPHAPVPGVSYSPTPVATATAFPTSGPAQVVLVDTPTPTPICTAVQPCTMVVSLPVMDESQGGAMIGTALLFSMGLVFVGALRLILFGGFLVGLVLFVVTGSTGWLYLYMVFQIIVVVVSVVGKLGGARS